MTAIIIQSALITLTVCCVISIFFIATIKIWWWVFKLDVYLFFLKNISEKLNSIQRIEFYLKQKKQNIKQWENIYNSLDDVSNHN